MRIHSLWCVLSCDGSSGANCRIGEVPTLDVQAQVVDSSFYFYKTIKLSVPFFYETPSHSEYSNLKSFDVPEPRTPSNFVALLFSRAQPYRRTNRTQSALPRPKSCDSL